jgi:SAM-dependent methyltransferase
VSPVKDQRPIWERIHRAEAGAWAQRSAFAVEVAALLQPGFRVLELGCGTGEDAAYFAAGGHEVLAVDFAAFAVNEAKRRHPGKANLSFAMHDLAQPFEQPDGSFDLVYARLSLHYFPDAQTRAIFREVQRLLAPGGLFAFMCKSPADPLYGQGAEIEPDMFESDHVRHFFSRRYAEELLRDGFEVETLREETGKRDGGGSAAYVVAIARRA